MPYDEIQYEVADATATISLDRPETLNALSRSLLEELEGALERAADTEGVRVVVLRGTGRAFSSGYDIGEGEAVLGTVDDRIGSPRTHIDTMVALPIPVIAAVEDRRWRAGATWRWPRT